MNCEQLIKILTEKKLKIATAESCTGGLISQMITSVPGSSEVFDCGIVAYSNEIKMKLLGVSENTLIEFGAVSEQTAAEMATGAVKVSGADFAVSVTGIAGPGGGTPQKPVGTVCIGICKKDGMQTTAKTFHFLGNRQEVREQTASEAINMLITSIF